MLNPIHAKETFNQVPALYDEIRPKYPERILRAIEQYANLQPGSCIVEVGPGTGQASEYFIERGYNLLGIDLGNELIKYLQNKFRAKSNASFWQSSFEEWQAEPAKFNLLLAAQSFHWIDPEPGIRKVAQILVPDGSIALLWNLDESENTEFWRRSKQVHKKYISSNAGNQGTNLKQSARQLLDVLEQSALYTKLEFKEEVWEQEYSADEWIKMRNTFSPDLTLSAEVREAFHKELKDIIAELGGSFTRYYRCVCICARVKK